MAFERLSAEISSLTPRYSYLWPGYSEQASNYHVLILALICNVKRREHLETWSKLVCTDPT